MWVTAVWLGQSVESLAVELGFITTEWTGFLNPIPVEGYLAQPRYRGESLDTGGRALSCHSVNRQTFLTPHWRTHPPWEVDGGRVWVWGGEGSWRREEKRKWDWYVKYKKDCLKIKIIICLLTLKSIWNMSLAWSGEIITNLLVFSNCADIN